MRMPAYLSRSRHGIFYYRYPIPRPLHPKGAATAIRLSLFTRDRCEALLAAHSLSCVAPLVGRNGSIRENGHLSPLVISSFQHAIAGARVPNAETFKEAADVNSLDNFMMDRILEEFGRSTDMPDKSRRMLLNEYRRANGAYCQAVLDFDSAFGSYDFGTDNQATVPLPSSQKSSDFTFTRFWEKT